jgi:hypothetical protein
MRQFKKIVYKVHNELCDVNQFSRLETIMMTGFSTLVLDDFSVYLKFRHTLKHIYLLNEEFRRAEEFLKISPEFKELEGLTIDCSISKLSMFHLLQTRPDLSFLELKNSCSFDGLIEREESFYKEFNLYMEQHKPSFKSLKC